MELVHKIQEIIDHVIPVEATKQDLILNELGLNVNIIGELKPILLNNEIIRIIKTIYFDSIEYKQSYISIEISLSSYLSISISILSLLILFFVLISNEPLNICNILSLTSFA